MVGFVVGVEGNKNVFSGPLALLFKLLKLVDQLVMLSKKCLDTFFSKSLRFWVITIQKIKRVEIVIIPIYPWSCNTSKNIILSISVTYTWGAGFEISACINLIIF